MLSSIFGPKSSDFFEIVKIFDNTSSVTANFYPLNDGPRWSPAENVLVVLEGMVAVGTPVDETLKDKLVTGTGAARRIFSTGRKYRDINEKEKIIESSCESYSDNWSNQHLFMLYTL